MPRLLRFLFLLTLSSSHAFAINPSCIEILKSWGLEHDQALTNAPTAEYLGRTLTPIDNLFLNAGFKRPKRLNIDPVENFSTSIVNSIGFFPLKGQVSLVTKQLNLKVFDSDPEVLVTGDNLVAVNLHELAHAYIFEEFFENIPEIRDYLELVRQNIRLREWVSAGLFSLSKGHPGFGKAQRRAREELRDLERIFGKFSNLAHQHFARWVITPYEELLADLSAVLVTGNGMSIAMSIDDIKSRNFQRQWELKDLSTESLKDRGRAVLVNHSENKSYPKGLKTIPSRHMNVELTNPHRLLDYNRSLLWKIFKEDSFYQGQPEKVLKLAMESVLEAIRERAKNPDSHSWSQLEINSHLESIIQSKRMLLQIPRIDSLERRSGVSVIDLSYQLSPQILDKIFNARGSDLSDYSIVLERNALPRGVEMKASLKNLLLPIARQIERYIQARLTNEKPYVLSHFESRVYSDEGRRGTKFQSSGGWLRAYLNVKNAPLEFQMGEATYTLKPGEILILTGDSRFDEEKGVLHRDPQALGDGMLVVMDFDDLNHHLIWSEQWRALYPDEAKKVKPVRSRRLREH